MYRVVARCLGLALMAAACERQLPIVESDYESASEEASVESTADPSIVAWDFSKAQRFDDNCDVASKRKPSLVDDKVAAGLTMIDVEQDELVFGTKDGVFARSAERGDPPMQLSKHAAREVVVQHGVVYFIPSDPADPGYKLVQTVPMPGAEGSETPLLLHGSKLRAENLARDERSVYITGDRGGCDPFQRLAIIDADGPSRLVDIGCVKDVTAHGGTAYVLKDERYRSAGYTISKLERDASMLEVLVPAPNRIADNYANGMSFTATREFVYFVVQGPTDTYLAAVSTHGGDVRVLAGPADISAIKAVDNSVYITSVIPSCLYRYDEKTGKVSAFAEDEPAVTAADDDYLYLVDDAITRVAR
jgi:hypothetical protein